MTRTSWNLLLAVSLALNIGFAASVAYTQWQNIRSGAKVSLSLPDQLGLSSAQREQWQAIEQGFITDLNANWDRIRQSRTGLINEIFSEHSDRTRIDAMQAEIAALQSTQQQRVIAQLLAERELLTNAQRATLKALLLSRHADEISKEAQLHSK